jgi:hypothetical protein
MKATYRSSKMGDSSAARKNAVSARNWIRRRGAIILITLHYMKRERRAVNPALKAVLLKEQSYLKASFKALEVVPMPNDLVSGAALSYSVIPSPEAPYVEAPEEAAKHFSKEFSNAGWDAYYASTIKEPLLFAMKLIDPDNWSPVKWKKLY